MSRNLSVARNLGDDLEVTRPEQVMVRLTADEKKAWQAAADADQRKLADWIRIVVNAHLGAKPKKK